MQLKFKIKSYNNNIPGKETLTLNEIMFLLAIFKTFNSILFVVQHEMKINKLTPGKNANNGL